jgi:hypothetical protein
MVVEDGGWGWWMSMMVECMKGNLLQASDQRMNSI